MISVDPPKQWPETVSDDLSETIKSLRDKEEVPPSYDEGEE
jgi:hypothetical protein